MKFNRFICLIFCLAIGKAYSAQIAIDQCLIGNLSFENNMNHAPADYQYQDAKYQLDMNTNQFIYTDNEGMVRTIPFALLKIEVSEPQTDNGEELVLKGISKFFAWRELYQINFTITQERDYSMDITGKIHKDELGKLMMDDFIKPEVILSNKLFSCFGAKNHRSPYRLK